MKFKHVILGIIASMLLVSCANESSSNGNSTNGTSNTSQYSNNGDSTTSSHTHTFASAWEHDETYHWHKSTCGHDVVGEKAKHTFKDEVTDPTYDAGGYTTHTCTVCDYSYKDAFTPSQKETERNKKLGITPVFDETNKTVTYGLYPQTHVNDENTVAALNKLTDSQNNGWFLYNDEYYAKKSANPDNASYTFDDGTPIESGATYWFKCEPIEWKILTFNDDTYSLVSTVLLDAHRYDSSSNNYLNSEIRLWLNDTFLKSAFALNSSPIQTITVDNSASTTFSSINPYVCENTEDKIYLLSYQDYNNNSYFSDGSARMCKTSEYARANGAHYNSNSSLYYGYYYTRTPYSDEPDFAWDIFTDGQFDTQYVYFSDRGVRPAITIKI